MNEYNSTANKTYSVSLNPKTSVTTGKFEYRVQKNVKLSPVKFSIKAFCIKRGISLQNQMIYFFARNAFRNVGLQHQTNIAMQKVTSMLNSGGLWTLE